VVVRLFRAVVQFYACGAISLHRSAYRKHISRS
jgi:hypothetical protein